jgi:hypothetical protein
LNQHLEYESVCLLPQLRIDAYSKHMIDLGKKKAIED